MQTMPPKDPPAIPPPPGPLTLSEAVGILAVLGVAAFACWQLYGPIITRMFLVLRQALLG